MDNNTLIYALFLYDRHSHEGVGFKVSPMRYGDYRLELESINYLNTHGKTTVSFATYFHTRAEAMKEARASFSKDVWNSLF